MAAPTRLTQSGPPYRVLSTRAAAVFTSLHLCCSHALAPLPPMCSWLHGVPTRSFSLLPLVTNLQCPQVGDSLSITPIKMTSSFYFMTLLHYVYRCSGLPPSSQLPYSLLIVPQLPLRPCPWGQLGDIPPLYDSRVNGLMRLLGTFPPPLSLHCHLPFHYPLFNLLFFIDIFHYHDFLDGTYTSISIRPSRPLYISPCIMFVTTCNVNCLLTSMGLWLFTHFLREVVNCFLLPSRRAFCSCRRCAAPGSALFATAWLDLASAIPCAFHAFFASPSQEILSGL